MKTTGVIRKLDELGRITLPIELRRSLDLDVKDGLEITVQDDCIILKKAESADIFTGSTEDLLEYEGKKVSRSSILSSGEAGRAECIRSLTESCSLSKLYKNIPLCTLNAICRGIFVNYREMLPP